jgi:uncharacterized protein YuzB (UPF0349 family)
MEKISKEEMDMAFFISRLFSKKQKAIVELCQTNLDRFYHEEHLTEYKTFFTSSEIDYQEYTCLNECKTCKINPYVKLNNQMISGSSPKDVLQQLIKNEKEDQR